MLGPEIRIMDVAECSPDFNARYAARGKIYAYTLDIGKETDPFSARFAWNTPYNTLDLDVIRELLPKLVGTHDFAGFQSTGNSSKTTVRTLRHVELKAGGLIGLRDHPDHFRLEIHGDAFLYKMVRNITGTLIEIARGRFPVEFLDQCLHSGGPFLGHCAPPHGLCLCEVQYEDKAES
jgi:tRNA pseudouridine38-40 synthase